MRANQPGLTISEAFDGDGQRVKRTQNGATSYELRSTLLKGATVTDLNAQGGKAVGYVYANGGLLARQNQAGGYVSWVHRDPGGTGQWESSSIGLGLGRTLELDPLLNDVGIDNPRDNAGGGGGDGRSYPTFGDPNAPNTCSYNDNVLPCDYVMKIVNREPILFQFALITSRIGMRVADQRVTSTYDGESILVGENKEPDPKTGQLASVTVRGTPEVLVTEAFGYHWSWLEQRQLQYLFSNMSNHEKTPQQLLEEGKAELKKRLEERPDCAKLFGGLKTALAKFGKLKFGFGFIDGGGIAAIKGNNVTLNPDLFTESGDTLYIADDIEKSIEGAATHFRFTQKTITLAGEIFAAFTLLHELGHKSKIYGEFDDDGDSSLPGGNALEQGANNEKIRAACFSEIKAQ